MGVQADAAATADPATMALIDGMIGQVRDAIGQGDWVRAGYLIDGVEAAFPELVTAPPGSDLAQRRAELSPLRELATLRQQLADDAATADPPAVAAAASATVDPAVAQTSATLEAPDPTLTVPTLPARSRTRTATDHEVASMPSSSPSPSVSSPLPAPGPAPGLAPASPRTQANTSSPGWPSGRGDRPSDSDRASSPDFSLGWQSVATPLPSVWDGVFEAWLLADAEDADPDEAFPLIDAPSSLFDTVLEAAAVEASARQAYQRLTAFAALFDGSGTDRRRIRSTMEELEQPAADDLYRVATDDGWGPRADHLAMRSDVARRLMDAALKTRGDQLEAAITNLDAIALIDPTDPRPVLLASMLRMSPGSSKTAPQTELTRAARGFRRLLRQHDGYLPAQHNLGLVVLKQGDRAAAVNILRTAAAGNPSSSRLDANLRRMLRLGKEGRMLLSDQDALAISGLQLELQPWFLSTARSTRLFDLQNAEEIYLTPDVMVRATRGRGRESAAGEGQGWLLEPVPLIRRVRTPVAADDQTMIWTVPNRQASGVLVAPRVVAVPRSVVTDPAGGTCAVVAVRSADGTIQFGQPLVVSGTYNVALVGLNRRTDAYLPPAGPPLRRGRPADNAATEARLLGQQPFDRALGKSGPPVAAETRMQRLGTGLLQLTKSGPAGSAVLVDGQLVAMAIDPPTPRSPLESLAEAVRESEDDAGSRTGSRAGQPLAVSASVIAGLLETARREGLIETAGGAGLPASQAEAAIVEVRSTRVLTAMGMQLPLSIADPLEECSCPGCGGTGRVSCDNGCNRGRLTESRRVRIGYNQLREEPIYQDKFFKVDCPQCQGGSVTCRQCGGRLYQRQ